MATATETTYCDTCGEVVEGEGFETRRGLICCSEKCRAEEAQVTAGDERTIEENDEADYPADWE